MVEKKREYTVEDFFKDHQDELELELLTSSLKGPLNITSSDVHRPAFALSGFMENYLNTRIQIIAETETLFLRSLDSGQIRDAALRIFSQPLCCIVITKGLDIPEVFIDEAERNSVPVLRTTQETTPFIHELTEILDYYFAPRTKIHGSLVDVYGVGLMFTGRSGIGKSEIVLDLVERGHRLVADDVVEILRRGDVVIGRGQEFLKHFMELRGIGIINVMDTYGIRAIRIQKRIEVVVELKDWDPGRDWDRHGLDEKHTEILGSKIRNLIIPIFPGKNITVIAETIALDHMLKIYGINAAKSLDNKISDWVKSKKRTRRYLRNDTE